MSRTNTSSRCAVEVWAVLAWGRGGGGGAGWGEGEEGEGGHPRLLHPQDLRHTTHRRRYTHQQEEKGQDQTTGK